MLTIKEYRIRLKPDAYRALKEYSKRRKEPMSVLASDILRHYLGYQKKPRNTKNKEYRG